MEDSPSPAAPAQPRRVGRRPMVLATVLAAAGIAGCGTSNPEPAADPRTPTVTGTPTAETDPEPTSDPSRVSAPSPLEGWTLEEKVGQLMMVGVNADAPQDAAYDAVSSRHVGNVFIGGRPRSGSQAVAAVVASLTDLVGPDTTRDTPLLVATDQEGGEVQVLGGEGFSSVPAALEQSTWSREELVAAAGTWGKELADVGVTMNLAPVADLVDIPDPSANGPIGTWGREYGHDAATVLAQATAFAAGMEASGVLATYKHFPGLGRVRANTDTTADVVDDVTARTDDSAVSVFADAIAGGARAVMMSSATYSLIDPTAPAVFSPVVVTDMLRQDLGFTGLIITDDVSAALQVQDWSPADRAVMAVRAGCDMVLASGDPSVAAEMVDALVAQAQSDPDFAARVEESAQRIVELKAGSLA